MIMLILWWLLSFLLSSGLLPHFMFSPDRFPWDVFSVRGVWSDFGGQLVSETRSFMLVTLEIYLARNFVFSLAPRTLQFMVEWPLTFSPSWGKAFSSKDGFPMWSRWHNYVLLKHFHPLEGHTCCYEKPFWLWFWCSVFHRCFWWFMFWRQEFHIFFRWWRSLLLCGKHPGLYLVSGERPSFWTLIGTRVISLAHLRSLYYWFR